MSPFARFDLLAISNRAMPDSKHAIRDIEVPVPEVADMNDQIIVNIHKTNIWQT